MGTSNHLQVFFVSEKCFDSFYQSLKHQYIHFAIVLLDNGNYPVPLEIPVTYISDLSCEHSGDTDIKYRYVFLTLKLKLLNLPGILKAEKTIHSYIPEQFEYAFSLHTNEYEYRKFPIYMPRVTSKALVKKKLIITNSKGYGNSILDMPVLQKFCSISREQGYELTIWHSYKESLNLSNLFLSIAHNMLNPYIDSHPIEPLLHTDLSEYSEILNMDSLIIRSSYSKFNDVCRFFHIENSSALLDDLQIVYDYPLSQEVISNIKSVKQKYFACIGVHFQTYDDALCATKRSWSWCNVESFLKLCHQNDIGVINLAPYAGDPLPWDLDLGTLTLQKIFQVNTLLDAYVGIDSSCAHIAGVMKKPNLVILSKPIDHVTQRPLSFNHTLISQEGDLDKIEPEKLLQNLCMLLQHELPLSSYTKNAYDYNLEDGTVHYI